MRSTVNALAGILLALSCSCRSSKRTSGGGAPAPPSYFAASNGTCTVISPESPYTPEQMTELNNIRSLQGKAPYALGTCPNHLIVGEFHAEVVHTCAEVVSLDELSLKVESRTSFYSKTIVDDQVSDVTLEMAIQSCLGL